MVGWSVYPHWRANLTFTWLSAAGTAPLRPKKKHKDVFLCWVEQGWAQPREQAAEERQEVKLFSVEALACRLISLVTKNACLDLCSFSLKGFFYVLFSKIQRLLKKKKIKHVFE